MSKEIHGPVLIADDEELHRDMLASLLMRRLEYRATQVSNGRAALDVLERDTKGDIKLVILDINMPVMDGLETLDIIKAHYPGLPVIMITGSADADKAALSIEKGATDFLHKPYESERMAVSVQNAMRLSVLAKEVFRLKSEREGRFTFDQIIGHDGGLAPVIAIARKSARSDLPVLITGETGTGKEVLTKAIHGESRRAGAPLITVNCGAIPENLVESTLFGHEKGAFTGATDKAPGKFREAAGGTLFLDEIGELPLPAQVKLLRALQQKEVEPVGASRAVPVDVRIIAATNRDLDHDVAQGLFREDLLFRLNVLTLELPPLRDRRPDIPALTRHFVMRLSTDFALPHREISDKALRVLQQADWPGNVRQLENTIKRALVLCDDAVITSEHLQLQGADTQSDAAAFKNDTGVSSLKQNGFYRADGTLKTAADIEAELMHIALREAEGNVTQAAAMIGMAKSTFYKKMDLSKIKRQQ